jgi:hypothetical protein
MGTLMKRNGRCDVRELQDLEPLVEALHDLLVLPRGDGRARRAGRRSLAPDDRDSTYCSYIQAKARGGEQMRLL